MFKHQENIRLKKSFMQLHLHATDNDKITLVKTLRYQHYTLIHSQKYR